MQKKYWIGYFLISPAFLVIFAVIIYPLFSAIVLSFRKFILIRPDLGMPFIGLENYSNAILNPVFLNAIKPNNLGGDQPGYPAGTGYADCPYPE